MGDALVVALTNFKDERMLELMNGMKKLKKQNYD
jgi:hypothetical protein